MKNGKKKLENIKKMFKELGTILVNMENGDLKKDYQRFLVLIRSDKADFKKMLEYIEKRIAVFKKTSNKIEGLSNENIVSFWQKIKDIVLDVYNKNKEIE